MSGGDDPRDPGDDGAPANAEDEAIGSSKRAMPSAFPIPLVRAPDAPPSSGRRSSPSLLPIPLVRDLWTGAREPDASPPLLRVRDLTVTFATDVGVVRALDGVSLDVPRGRTVALVGESGCGKTVTALSILRLLPEPIAAIEGGSIDLDREDLLALSEREMRAVRGAKIAMIFQEPMSSLNPVYTVGAQIAEAIRLHRRVSRAAARREAVGLLRKVGFPEPEARIDSYPHELSGGMRQRVMIAAALAPGPSLLIADEPTTALDMTTQAQILDLLQRIQEETSMSLLLIAHDLAVVAELADEVVVLYAGVVVERGPVRPVLSTPAHPYTRALLRSIPAKGFRPRRVQGEKAPRLPTIAGGQPDLRDPPPGCRFYERCDVAIDRCREAAPPLFPVGLGPSASRSRHSARCFLAELPGTASAGQEGAP